MYHLCDIVGITSTVPPSTSKATSNRDRRQDEDTESTASPRLVVVVDPSSRLHRHPLHRHCDGLDATKRQSQNLSPRRNHLSHVGRTDDGQPRLMLAT